MASLNITVYWSAEVCIDEKPSPFVRSKTNFNLYSCQWLVTKSADHLFLTFGLTLSGCWIHHVVLVTVTGEAAVHTQLITHVVLQARVDL